MGLSGLVDLSSSEHGISGRKSGRKSIPIWISLRDHPSSSYLVQLIQLHPKWIKSAKILHPKRRTSSTTQILLQLLPRDPDWSLKLRSRFHPLKKVTDKTPLHGSLGRTPCPENPVWKRYRSEPTFKTRQTVKVIISHLQGGLLSTLSRV